MHRRAFLTSLAASTTLVAGRAWSAGGDAPRLLTIFLRGGYDALSLIVPTGSDFYYQARPNISIARPDHADPNAAIALDGDWGLHPALKDSILPLWQSQQIAFVPFAGTDDLTRSHFETQDTIEMGQPLGGRRNYRSGFLARMAAQMGGPRPVAFTVQPPLAFQGGPAVPNVAVITAGQPALDAHQTDLISRMYRDHALAGPIGEGFKVRERAYRSIAADLARSTPSAFDLAMRRVGQMLREDYNLAFLDVGGWDTHVNQGAATGVLADRARQFGRGLTALIDQLGAQVWAETTIVVVSEFGRTFRENGDKGTDHGHGSVYWVLGGSIKGGRMVGPQVQLTSASLNQARDLPVLTDYRTLIGHVAGRMFGLSAAKLDTVFPHAPQVDLGLA